ncbi:molybdenum cofactor biosynthesis protein MoaE [Chloroflexota bacterium]
MVKITTHPLSPEAIVEQTKTTNSGCVATYVGLIRDNSKGKRVLSVEYSDPEGKAAEGLKQIVDAANRKWQLNAMAIHHRIGRLNVGDINLVVAVAAGHRGEGFAACQYAIDQFKEKLPTHKKETYEDGSCFEGD